MLLTRILFRFCLRIQSVRSGRSPEQKRCVSGRPSGLCKETGCSATDRRCDCFLRCVKDLSSESVFLPD
ncbi:MAG TPA: hypothetical protein DIT89_13455 [Planctomycetaceae bacterium]|nr:hypothetical protein [Planctomycetaceae bacterium]